MLIDLERSPHARAYAECLEGDPGRWEAFMFGVPDVDARLGGLARRALHEAVPINASQLAAAVGFGLGLALRAAGSRPIAWATHDLFDSELGRLDGSGLAAFGAQPEKVIVIRLRRAEDILHASLEVARSAGLGAALVEVRGDARAVDFTATRRLALAAKASGVTMILVRNAWRPDSTAATTCWSIGSAPSVLQEAGAPGRPAFHAALLRHRGGIPERTWRMEWNRDQRSFAEAPPLSGTMVPAAADQPS